MKKSYNKKSGTYKNLRDTWNLEEKFFVSYAVRGPTFINEYGAGQDDMPLRGPLTNSTVEQPGPLNNQQYSVCFDKPFTAVL